MRRFSRRISGDSLRSASALRKVSIPPLNSIVRIAVVESRRRVGPSTSDNSEIVCKFGRKRRLVLMLEWLTLWPTWTPLPVTGHLRAILYLTQRTGVETPAVSRPGCARGQARRRRLGALVAAADKLA